jgi:hypothetical protein
LATTIQKCNLFKNVIIKENDHNFRRSFKFFLNKNLRKAIKEENVVQPNSLGNFQDDQAKVESENDEIRKTFKTKKALNLIKGFSLSITYAATICGTGSLIGTSSNIVFKGYFETNYPGDKLNFLTFMIYSLPISIVLLLCAWAILSVMWLPKGKFFSFNFSKKKKQNEISENSNLKSVEDLIREEYEKLGPYT